MTMTYRLARRIAVLAIGGTVLLLGIALLVLPGPGILLAAAGLAILGAEFAWARRWLLSVRRGISGVGRQQRMR